MSTVCNTPFQIFLSVRRLNTGVPDCFCFTASVYSENAKKCRSCYTYFYCSELTVGFRICSVNLQMMHISNDQDNPTVPYICAFFKTSTALLENVLDLRKRKGELGLP